MNYFVTGATGFIGRNLVGRLLQREGTVFALVTGGLARASRGAEDRMGSRRGAHRPDRR